MDLSNEYLEYMGDTEPPIHYHRWSLLSAVGAMLGRNVWINHGHSRIFPNLYLMFVGDPGTRKSTAIKMVKSMITESGYSSFAKTRSTREKFLMDLAGEDSSISQDRNGKTVFDSLTTENLWGEYTPTEPREVYIVADEFNEFVSERNMPFYTTLGTLWDWDEQKLPYEDRVKNSASVRIYQPTVSLLGGTTQELFARAFPPEMLGTGFLARLVLIYGERSDRKIAFPKIPDDETKTRIAHKIAKIVSVATGARTWSNSGRDLMEKIYLDTYEVSDIRFKGYNQRRFTQLMKLALICSVISMEQVIGEESVLAANTILTHAESLMPRALGEFGKGRNSDVAAKIISVLEASSKILAPMDIWKQVSKDLDKISQMYEIIQNLVAAEKVQFIKTPGGLSGYAPKVIKPIYSKYVNWDLLTTEERNMI